MEINKSLLVSFLIIFLAGLVAIILFFRLNGSFRVNSNIPEKQLSNSYTDNGTVVHADAASFVIVQKRNSRCLQYEKDRSNVYWNSSEVIHGANPQTFTLIKDIYGKCSNYSKDDKNVFFTSEKLPSFVDNTSFAVLNSDFAKDSAQAYFEGEVIQNADVPTFTPLVDPLLNGTHYSKDRFHVYVSSPQSKETRIVAGADPTSFTVLQSITVPCFPDRQSCEENFPFSVEIAKDNKNVYGDVGNVISADAMTFEILKTSPTSTSVYSRDAEHIYVGNVSTNNKILDADYTTFKVLSLTDAQDKNHKYFEGEIEQ